LYELWSKTTLIEGMRNVKTYLFFIVVGIALGACSRPSGCPSTFITSTSTPRISQRDVDKWFAFKEKKHSSAREQDFFSARSNTYNRKATQKSYFAVSTRKSSVNTERSYFGTFSSGKNKYRDMDAFSSKPKKTRAQKEADHFSSPYRKKNRAGNGDYFLMTQHSGSNKMSKDFFSTSSQKRRQKARSNSAEETPFGSKQKKKQFEEHEYQPDLFEDKVLWYKREKRDKNTPKDSMGNEVKEEKEKE